MLLIMIMDKGFGLCPTDDNISSTGSFSELLFSVILEKYIACDICTVKFPVFETTSLICHPNWLYLHAGIIDAGAQAKIV